MDELEFTRAETIIEISDKTKEIIVDTIKRHGDNDPHMPQLIAAALTLIIRDINKLAPGFTGLMGKMLEEEDDQ